MKAPAEINPGVLMTIRGYDARSGGGYSKVSAVGVLRGTP
jgi:hypothetical protein